MHDAVNAPGAWSAAGGRTARSACGGIESSRIAQAVMRALDAYRIVPFEENPT
jgi:hypothetical protein